MPSALAMNATCMTAATLAPGASLAGQDLATAASQSTLCARTADSAALYYSVTVPPTSRVDVTVTQTEGSGFFRVAREFQDPPTTSSINWYTDGQKLANMAMVKTTSGITVQGGGAGRAHLIIDVLGFIG